MSSKTKLAHINHAVLLKSYNGLYTVLQLYVLVASVNIQLYCDVTSNE